MHRAPFDFGERKKLEHKYNRMKLYQTLGIKIGERRNMSSRVSPTFNNNKFITDDSSFSLLTLLIPFNEPYVKCSSKDYLDSCTDTSFDTSDPF